MTSADERVDLALIATGFALVFFAIPHGIFGDAVVRFEALQALLDHGVNKPTAYSLVGPLLATPFYLLGRIALGPEWWCARFNTIVLALGVLYARTILRSRLERRLLNGFTLTVLAASMFSNHLRDFNSEPFTAVFVAFGLLAVVHGRERTGWALVVVGVVNTPASMVGLGFASAARFWRTRRWQHLLAVPAAVALFMLESWMRRGSPLTTGYENNGGFRTILPYSGIPGFSYPMFFGLLSLIFSFGKGLVFFAPGLLFPLRRASLVPERIAATWRLWLWFLFGLLLVYSKWWAWYGGMSWGPRLLLFASVPASLSLVARLRDPAIEPPSALMALTAALALSCWVAIAGALFAQQDLSICAQNFFAFEFACWYTPEFSVLWHPFVARESVKLVPGLYAGFSAVVGIYLVLPATLELPSALRRPQPPADPSA